MTGIAEEFGAIVVTGIAEEFGAIVVTRNVMDFVRQGIQVLDD